jgi:hypothetical protein
MKTLMTPTHSDKGPAVERGFVRRTPRYCFVVDVEMTDIQSGTQIRGRTKQLSLLGCGLDALKLFPKGTNVKIELSHQSAFSHGESGVQSLASLRYSVL